MYIQCNRDTPTLLLLLGCSKYVTLSWALSPLSLPPLHRYVLCCVVCGWTRFLSLSEFTSELPIGTNWKSTLICICPQPWWISHEKVSATDFPINARSEKFSQLSHVTLPTLQRGRGNCQSRHQKSRYKSAGRKADFFATPLTPITCFRAVTWRGAPSNYTLSGLCWVRSWDDP